MDAIELMASAMHAAQARLDVSAHNLANLSADGFRRRIARTTFAGSGGGGLRVTSAIDAGQGPLRRTGRGLDLALAGAGSLFVRDANGRRIATRGGSFERDAAGRLIDERGRVLLGERGPLVAGEGATIDARGVVRDAGGIRGRLAVAGSAEVRAGFLEAPNVDAVREMIDVLDSQRAFETAQKALVAIDEVRHKDATDLARVAA